MIYDFIGDCVVGVSIVLSESWNVSWWESYDGELFVSGCLTGSLLGMLCPIGAGVNFVTTVFPGWDFSGVSLEL